MSKYRLDKVKVYSIIDFGVQIRIERGRRRLRLGKKIIVSCSDGRFFPSTIQRFGGGEYDVFAVPGGALAFSFAVRFPAMKLVSRRAVELLLKAGEVDRIVVVSHEDCRAYHHELSRKSDEQRKEAQIQDLRKAKQTLNKIAPGLEVELYYARFGAQGSIVYDPIV